MMMPSKRLSSPFMQRGFTLIELLVAIAIFAFIASVSYGALSSVLTTDAVLKEESQSLKQLQRAFLIISRDMKQIVERNRSAGINTPQPQPKAALKAPDEDLGALIAFTKTGQNTVLTGTRQSSLQRVAYVLEDDALWRHAWSMVDYKDLSPMKAKLMDNVNAVTFEFTGTNGEGGGAWNSLEQVMDDGANIAKPRGLPEAIKISIEHDKLGKIYRLFAR